MLLNLFYEKVIFLGCNTDQLGYLKEFVRRKFKVIGLIKILMHLEKNFVIIS